jgi:hypothetical protein
LGCLIILHTKDRYTSHNGVLGNNVRCDGIRVIFIRKKGDLVRMLTVLSLTSIKYLNCKRIGEGRL